MLDGMFECGEPLSSDNPFWFANDALITEFWHAEIRSIVELFAKHLDLIQFFDLPEANAQQRAACFALLAHCKLVGEIDERFLGFHEQPPSLSDEEEEIFERTHSLFDVDAPAWVLEVDQVAELLPSRIFNALPEPLRAGGYGFARDNPERMQAIEAAIDTLSTVEKVRALTECVLEQQLKRLGNRWAAATPALNATREIIVRERSPKRPKGRKKHDEQRRCRDKLVAEIADISPTLHEYLKLMDECKVQHPPTWSGWPGSWSEAYKNPRLRKLIHQDKSRALDRVRREPNSN